MTIAHLMKFSKWWIHIQNGFLEERIFCVLENYELTYLSDMLSHG